MVSVFSYLITMMGGIFWLFRVIVTLSYTMGWNIGITPLNIPIEVIILFATLVCMIFIVKRNIIGALAYLLMYGLYFGNDFFNNIMSVINGQSGVMDYLSIIISFLGILIPFLTVMDILINKDRTSNVKNKKTDWFYQNDEYNREYDERADRNQYKF